MKKLLPFLLLFTLACQPQRPDCTIREVSPGQFEPWGDCDNCTSLSIVGPTGSMRSMGPTDMDRYVQQYPPSANYNPQSPSLSDWMLYHYLLTGPRANHYHTVYVNQYRGYSAYRTAHPGYRPPIRYSAPRVVNKTTIINNTRVVNNRPIPRSYATNPRSYATNPRTYPSTGYSSRPLTSPPTRFGGSSPSARVSRSYSAPARSYSSPSRSSFSSSSRRK